MILKKNKKSGYKKPGIQKRHMGSCRNEYALTSYQYYYILYNYEYTLQHVDIPHFFLFFFGSVYIYI